MRILKYAIWTLLSATWRAAVAIFDWRTHLRKLRKQPIVDVVFVTNMRDETDRSRFLGLWKPSNGHFNGPRYWFNGIAGRTRAFNVTSEEMGTSKGRRKSREYFIAATRWAQDNGAKVILLAAGTKRLFGDEGASLRELFPDLIFTIGDNGTMIILIDETLRALRETNLHPGFCKIGVLGPYGFLGEMMVQVLVEKGYSLIGAGPNSSGLKKINEVYGIETCLDFTGMGQVDAVVACTHSGKISLTAESIELIRKSDKKLLVIDVAEPSNLKYKEYLKCRNKIIRQDAGNAYSKDLKYVLGAVSYRLFRLTQGVAFGCFAEAISIASDIKRKEVEV